MLKWEDVSVDPLEDNENLTRLTPYKNIMVSNIPSCRI